MTDVLDAAGLTAVEERVYRALIAVPAADPDTLAATVAIPGVEVVAAVGSLEDKGLVSRAAGQEVRYIAAAPDIALEPLVAERETQLQVTRAALAELADEYRSARAHRASELVEVLTGESAIQQRFQQMQRQARTEMLMLTKPPYVVPGESNDAEVELLQRGVPVRSLYDRNALESHENFSAIRRYVDAGEHARVTGRLPVKLVVVDTEVALLPLAGDDDRQALSGALLVHPCGLLDSLVALFETLWVLGTPLPKDAGAGAETAGAPPPPGRNVAFSGEEHEILAMLFAGLTDQAIGKQLGASPRTVQRHVRGLMDRHGARSRFQLGAIARERGLLD